MKKRHIAPKLQRHINNVNRLAIAIGNRSSTYSDKTKPLAVWSCASSVMHAWRCTHVDEHTKLATLFNGNALHHTLVSGTYAGIFACGGNTNLRHNK